mmetsp:Transcript_25147/g.39730  ORF Transcript_25147/g.39730 Transcript_25147/m.39730 type:complete len:386 (-) Transcript_25147:58-1215(-)
MGICIPSQFRRVTTDYPPSAPSIAVGKETFQQPHLNMQPHLNTQPHLTMQPHLSTHNPFNISPHHSMHPHINTIPHHSMHPHISMRTRNSNMLACPSPACQQKRRTHHFILNNLHHSLPKCRLGLPRSSLSRLSSRAPVYLPHLSRFHHRLCPPLSLLRPPPRPSLAQVLVLPPQLPLPSLLLLVLLPPSPPHHLQPPSPSPCHLSPRPFPNPRQACLLHLPPHQLRFRLQRKAGCLQPPPPSSRPPCQHHRRPPCRPRLVRLYQASLQVGPVSRRSSPSPQPPASNSSSPLRRGLRPPISGCKCVHLLSSHSIPAWPNLQRLTEWLPDLGFPQLLKVASQASLQYHSSNFSFNNKSKLPRIEKEFWHSCLEHLLFWNNFPGFPG